MPAFIKDLWIISRDGRPLIEVINNTGANSYLLGPLVSAIESFSKELIGSELQSLTLGEKKIIISPCLKGHVYLVSDYDINVKEKKIKKIFKIIADFFEDLYSLEDIVSWSGDPTVFDKFKDRIDVYFEMYDL